jgi:hypothetical protein
VSEQCLNNAQLSAILKKMRGEGVTQAMHRYLLPQPGTGCGLTARKLQRSGAHVAVLLPGREQVMPGFEGQTVAVQNGPEAGREHGVTVFLAFALFHPVHSSQMRSPGISSRATLPKAKMSLRTVGARP